MLLLLGAALLARALLSAAHALQWRVATATSSGPGLPPRCWPATLLAALADALLLVVVLAGGALAVALGSGCGPAFDGLARWAWAAQLQPNPRHLFAAAMATAAAAVAMDPAVQPATD